MKKYNRNINFKNLKTYNSLASDSELVEYLNSFEGDNIFFKFVNILKIWDRDVSPIFEFEIDEKPIKIQLSYIISELEKNCGIEFVEDKDFKISDVRVSVGIPEIFSHIDPLYLMVKNITIGEYNISLDGMGIEDRKKLIDGLPASYFNIILKIFSQDKRIFSIDNPSLSKFKLNFTSSEIYFFIKNMMKSFSEYYFQDIVYYMSSKIGYDGVMKSTPLELEYYIDKLSEENKDPSNDNIKSI